MSALSFTVCEIFSQNVRDLDLDFWNVPSQIVILSVAIYRIFAVEKCMTLTFRIRHGHV